MYANFIPIDAVESFVLFPFTGDYLNLEIFKIDVSVSSKKNFKIYNKHLILIRL
jgi:hypothetical protein